MNDQNQTGRGRETDQRGRVGRFIGFLLAFAAMAWWWVDPPRLFHGQPLIEFPGAVLTPRVWQACLARPGGLLSALCGWLVQGYYHRWLGVLLLTAAVALVVVLAEAWVTAVAGRRVAAVRWAPAVVLLAAAIGYTELMTSAVALALVLLAGLVQLRAAGQPWPLRLALALTSATVLYYLHDDALPACLLLVGGGAVVARRDWLVAVTLAVATIALPWLGVLLADAPLVDAWLALLPTQPKQGWPLRAVLIVVTPLVLLIGGAVGRRWPARPAPRYDFVAGAVLAIAVALVIRVTADPILRNLLAVQACAAEADWPAAIEALERIPPTIASHTVSYTAIRALAEEGRLLDELFRYPQSPFSMMTDADPRQFPGQDAVTMRKECYFSLGDLLLRLGLLNDAEHESHEATEIYLDHPVALIRLAKVYWAKENPAAAARVLRVARRDPIRGREAAAMLRRLAADPTGASDAEIQLLRQRRLREDCNPGRLNLIERCRALLRADPTNRLAYDYLVAELLLRRQLNGVVAELPRLRSFGYDRLPRHLAEAATLWATINRDQPDTGGLPLDPDLACALGEFCGLVGLDPDQLGKAAGQPVVGAAADQLMDRFSEGFFFYYTFGVSGDFR